MQIELILAYAAARTSDRGQPGMRSEGMMSAPVGSADIVERLQGISLLRDRQRRELAEILTGWETRNRYEIDDGSDRPMLYAGEVGGGIGRILLRQVLGRTRPFTVEVKDELGSTVLRVKRPFRWFFSRAEVYDGTGRLLGSVQQKWAFLRRRYLIEGPTGAVGAELFGPFFKPWTFEIRVRGEKVGTIAKRWSGLLKEAFTTADNFGLELGPQVDDRPGC